MTEVRGHRGRAKRVAAVLALAGVMIAANAQLASAHSTSGVPYHAPPRQVRCDRGYSIGNYMHIEIPAQVYARNTTSSEDREWIWWRGLIQAWDTGSGTWRYVLTDEATWRRLGLASDSRGMISYDNVNWQGYNDLPRGYYIRAVYQLWWTSNGSSHVSVVPAGHYFMSGTKLSTAYCRF